LSAVWRRQWIWPRAARGQDVLVKHIDAASLTDALATINNIALSTELARAHLPALAPLLRDALEPIAVDAAYAMASAGADAVPPMRTFTSIRDRRRSPLRRSNSGVSQPLRLEPRLDQRKRFGDPSGVGQRVRQLDHAVEAEAETRAGDLVDAGVRRPPPRRKIATPDGEDSLKPGTKPDQKDRML
jgi:hypothetical protein